MLVLILPALSLILASLHVVFSQQPRTRERVAEITLLYLFAIQVGLFGLMASLWQTVRAESTAQFIGWPPGNPFEYEVGAANLAFAVLGVLCIWKRGSFWTATGIGWSVFLLGAAAVHLYQIRAGQPYAPGNAGPMLYLDVLLPLLVLGLLAVRSRGEVVSH